MQSFFPGDEPWVSMSGPMSGHVCQVEAFERGLIPFIPADRAQPGAGRR